MATPHERVVKTGEVTVAQLKRIMNQLGNIAYPGGKVTAAYATVRRALANNLTNTSAVADALTTLQGAVRAASSDVLRQGAELGMEQARKELRIYRIPDTGGGFPLLEQQAGVEAIMAMTDEQIRRTLALVRVRDPAMEALIFGTAQRSGVLRANSPIQEAAKWISTMTTAAWVASIIRAKKTPEGEGIDFIKQAVAAIDERTTDCCLRVHGQTQPLDKPYKLTGTPRFADEMERPPFHEYCRTVSVLVRRQDKDDELSLEMRDAAKSELTAREKGTREVIHPASATSRRG